MAQHAACLITTNVRIWKEKGSGQWDKRPCTILQFDASSRGVEVNLPAISFHQQKAGKSRDAGGEFLPFACTTI